MCHPPFLEGNSKAPNKRCCIAACLYEITIHLQAGQTVKTETKENIQWPRYWKNTDASGVITATTHTKQGMATIRAEYTAAGATDKECQERLKQQINKAKKSALKFKAICAAGALVLGAMIYVPKAISNLTAWSNLTPPQLVEVREIQNQIAAEKALESRYILDMPASIKSEKDLEIDLLFKELKDKYGLDLK
jgi:hypothetical protein